MSRPYKELRSLMHEYELTNELLGREIGCAASTVSNKLNGHFPWTSEEMWKIMELTNQPPQRFHIIFPRSGQNEHGAHHRTFKRAV